MEITNIIYKPLYFIIQTIWIILRIIHPIILKVRYILYSIYMCVRLRTKRVAFLFPVSKIMNPEFIEIDEGSSFGRLAVITTWPQTNQKPPKLKIGKNCNFGDFIHLTSSNSVTIGDNVLTGRWVTITDNSHGDTNRECLKIPPEKRPIFSKGSVVIEDNVWIGDKVTILPNTRIGKGSIIGANSVVAHDIPAYSIVVGNPARILSNN